MMDPHYLKIVLERAMSLDFKDSIEAQFFFSGVKELLSGKVNIVNCEIQAALSITDEGAKEKKLKTYDKQLKSLVVIEQYCEYILNKDREGFKVELMVDE